MIALSLRSRSAKAVANFFRLGGNFHGLQSANVAGVVRHFSALHPFAEIFQKRWIVLEILAPEGRIFDARLGHGAVEVEHADESGPGSAPVGDGEDGAFVKLQAVQDVMRILPDGFGDDERGFGGDAAEDFHAVFLGINKAVTDFLAKAMGAIHLAAQLFDRGDQGLLHLQLFGLAGAIGRGA